MHVAGYIRVSTEQQKAEGSHENQEERLDEWADREGHDIEFYRDIAVSGQSDDRDGYDELMSNAEQYDAVVVRELSRFGRNLQRVLNDIEDLHDRGVKFVSLKESIDLTTAQGRLFLNMVGAFNQFWADLARERAEEMIQRRREQGKPIGRPKKLDEDQLEEVREWRDLGLSYRDIAALVADKHGVDVSRMTVYRYCQEVEA